MAAKQARITALVLGHELDVRGEALELAFALFQLLLRLGAAAERPVLQHRLHVARLLHDLDLGKEVVEAHLPILHPLFHACLLLFRKAGAGAQAHLIHEARAHLPNVWHLHLRTE